MPRTGTSFGGMSSLGELQPARDPHGGGHANARVEAKYDEESWVERKRWCVKGLTAHHSTTKLRRRQVRRSRLPTSRDLRACGQGFGSANCQPSRPAMVPTEAHGVLAAVVASLFQNCILSLANFMQQQRQLPYLFLVGHPPCTSELNICIYVLSHVSPL